MKITQGEVLSAKLCWTEESVREWFSKPGRSDGVSLSYVLKDDGITAAEKVAFFLAFNQLGSEELSRLAVDFAEHWLPGNAHAGYLATRAKRFWLDNGISDEDLKNAEQAAWNEAKEIPESKAAAYACKKDGYTALLGASANAGGWYGENVDPDEKQWQVSQLLNAIGG